MSGSDQDFKQSLSLTDATMLVAGSMIGSGIFIVSADVTRNLGSSGWSLRRKASFASIAPGGDASAGGTCATADTQARRNVSPG